MSKSSNLASFCRLCLIKTANKVPVFGGDQANVSNLLELIELSINPEVESDAILCYDCFVTLEGFLQFKKQCHVNDEYLKKLPPKNSVEESEAIQNEVDLHMECEYLNDDDDSEAEELFENVDLIEVQTTTKMKASPEKLVPEVKQLKALEDSRNIGESSRNRKQIAKPSYTLTVQPVKKAYIPEFPGRQPTDEELPKLQDSYPDWFHFERGARSIFFHLIWYGERFSSAVHGPRYTYWQCASRSKHKCPATLHVKNDYTTFERRFEHTHVDFTERRKFELFTAREALPAVFKIGWHRLQEKKEAREQRAELKLRMFKKNAEEVPNCDDDENDEDDLII